VVVAFCLLRFVSLVTGGGRRRWQVAVTAGVLAALITLATLAGGISTTAGVLAGPAEPGRGRLLGGARGYLGRRWSR